MKPESPDPSPLSDGNDTDIGSSSEIVESGNPEEEKGTLSVYNPRTLVGGGMERFTSLINDNIIAARYGVFATIALLTAYGISNTPLFFRYRTVADIPKSYFIGRRRLYCRVIGVHRDSGTNTTEVGDNSILISVRNLSPIGMLLPTSWFESLMKLSPSSSTLSLGSAYGGGCKPEETNKELLRIQVAGILSPPLVGYLHNPEEFLERLAKKRTLVSCQLLGRKVLVPQRTDEDSACRQNKGEESSGIHENKKHASFYYSMINSRKDVDDHQVALCRLKYRPNWQFFSTDLAEVLITTGNASVDSNVLNVASSSNHALAGDFQHKIEDASQRIEDIRGDVNYLGRLNTFEFDAAKKSKGMWSVPEVRQIKREIVDEVDFQTKASPLQKIW
eukprot:CAMPEP_0201194640 /NCGR_PEP_ID=MMETSP0851-20130426/149522_1 /ASSEMBLY_ACC=CAM_ASM_000631 /TAXON_ID=183588 /ORGANISM="Pseudo-nitzschia fraudulenta, Strain WWA7" /LENGTH=389 /DNA_ID=CAMNT_0047481345 /DNA_START=40 /DNA_END=1206 /DNA_ORIENTATION=+